MFCVNDEPSGPLHFTIGARWIGALAILALVAGPGFFAFALMDALYRDVPPASVSRLHVKATAGGSASQMPGSQLSPVADKVTPGTGSTHSSSAARTSSNNPIHAYLNLTGRSDFNALPSHDGALDSRASTTTYRTVCVRLCDGSYFPISEAATNRQFAADEAQCQSRCGSPARLYVYANGSETPLQMRDLSGNTYLELETAFRFHTSYDAQCKCRSQPWTLASKNRHRGYAELEAAMHRSAPMLPVAVVADQTSPDDVPQLADVSHMASLENSNVAQVQAQTLISVEESVAQTVAARAATESEVAAITDEWKWRDRIAAVARRTAIVADLELPGRSRPVRLAAAAQPQIPIAPNFLFLDPATFEQSSGPGAVAVAELSGPVRQEAQRSATDILMRNLNPHF